MLVKYFRNSRKLNYGRHIIEEWVKSINYSNCLDIGGGEGKDLNIVKNISPKSHLYSVEVMPQNITKLEKIGVKTYPIDIEENSLPFEDSSLDLIIANQIIEHTKQIFWIHHNIFKKLKVGGSLIVGVPNMASYYNRIFLLFGYQPKCIKINSAHVRGLTKKGYIEFLDEFLRNGYELKDFKGSNFVPFPDQISYYLSMAFKNLSTSIFFHIKKTKKYDNQFIENIEKFETNYKN